MPKDLFPIVRDSYNPFILRCRIRKALGASGRVGLMEEFDLQIDKRMILSVPTAFLPRRIIEQVRLAARQYVTLR